MSLQDLSKKIIDIREKYSIDDIDELYDNNCIYEVESQGKVVYTKSKQQLSLYIQKIFKDNFEFYYPSWEILETQNNNKEHLILSRVFYSLNSQRLYEKVLDRIELGQNGKILKHDLCVSKLGILFDIHHF